MKSKNYYLLKKLERLGSEKKKKKKKNIYIS